MCILLSVFVVCLFSFLAHSTIDWLTVFFFVYLLSNVLGLRNAAYEFTNWYNCKNVVVLFFPYFIRRAFFFLPHKSHHWIKFTAKWRWLIDNNNNNTTKAIHYSIHFAFVFVLFPFLFSVQFYSFSVRIRHNQLWIVKFMSQLILILIRMSFHFEL